MSQALRASSENTKSGSNCPKMIPTETFGGFILSPIGDVGDVGDVGVGQLQPPTDGAGPLTADRRSDLENLEGA